MEADEKAKAAKSPDALVRYWLKEIDTSERGEDGWRRYAQSVIDTYDAESEREYERQRVGLSAASAADFNILWSNTETLAPALYNSTPRPDVRRRFDDADPVAMAVADVLERCITYQLDAYDFDAVMESVVHDYLLTGRGVPRVRLELGDYEAVTCELVQWDRLRLGYAKRWEQCPWVAFEHHLTRDQLSQMFGEIGAGVPLDVSQDSDDKDADDDTCKRARVYEVWNKEAQEVLFIAPSYKAAPLQQIPDPLGLHDFWPIPRPLYAVTKTTSLKPTPEYKLYQAQAEELNRVSRRINKLLDAIKVRGIYDAALSELGTLFNSDDNLFSPAENTAKLYNLGGIDKGIWLLPIDPMVVALRELVQQREAIKQVIYEITGIADVLRGASDASETLGAQQIKQNWAGLRLQRRQKRIQIQVRDVIRMTGELIAEHFSLETLQRMSGVNLPTAVQKQMAQLQLQQLMGPPAPPMPGAPPMAPPPPPDPKLVMMAQSPTWEDVMAVLRGDPVRDYKIDIETDSTIEGARQFEQKNLAELMQGIGSFLQTIGPTVQMGFLPMPAAKSMLLSVVRKFKLGSEVEDELDKMGEQPMAPPPEQQKASEEQAKAKGEVEKSKTDLEGQRMKLDQYFQKRDFDLSQREMRHSFAEQLFGLQQQQAKEAAAAVDKSKVSMDQHANMATETLQAVGLLPELLDALAGIKNDSAVTAAAQTQALGAITQQLGALTQHVMAGKEIVYGNNGKVKTIGGRAVTYDKAGRISGMKGLQ